MNGYDEKRHFDDEPEPGNFVRAFDAFPKAKPQYVTRTSGGGKWTVAMIVVSAVLFWSELARWWQGEEDHTFSVEKGVGHSMQINLDVVLRMNCKDLHVNVQDAAGDRILAASRLQEDYYRSVRTYMVVIWMVANAILAMAVSEAYGIHDVGNNIYLSFILWSVAVLAVFRAIGSTTFAILNVINMVVEGRVRISLKMPEWAGGIGSRVSDMMSDTMSSVVSSVRR
ncbi:hypothetical protein CHU98_g11552 [Xylaria longipes]|nr:hypothetical protein CHU98_g11552 [Xylaria longipes]